MPGLAGRWFTPEEARAATEVGLCQKSVYGVEWFDGWAGAATPPRQPARSVLARGGTCSTAAACTEGNVWHAGRLHAQLALAPRLCTTPPLQERERLKKSGYVQAAANSVLEKAGEGTGTWMTLRRPGAKRAHDGGDGGAHGQASAACRGGSARRCVERSRAC